MTSHATRLLRALLAAPAMAFLVTGCGLMKRLSATPYHGLGSPTGSIVHQGGNVDLGVHARDRDFGRNARMNARLQEGRGGMKVLRLENRSDRTLRLDPARITYHIGGDAFTPIPLEEIYRLAKLRTWSYLWWSGLFGAIRSCENGECRTLLLPVGLLYGLGNGLYASSGNSAMRRDLEAAAWKADSIPPGGSAEGTLFFRFKDRTYRLEDLERSTLHLPYWIGDSAGAVEVRFDSR